MLNHDCRPNAVATFHGPTLVVRTTEAISDMTPAKVRHLETIIYPVITQDTNITNELNLRSFQGIFVFLKNSQAGSMPYTSMSISESMVSPLILLGFDEQLIRALIIPSKDQIVYEKW